MSSAPVRSAMCFMALCRGTPRFISRLVSSISSAKVGLTRRISSETEFQAMSSPIPDETQISSRSIESGRCR